MAGIAAFVIVVELALGFRHQLRERFGSICDWVVGGQKGLKIFEWGPYPVGVSLVEVRAPGATPDLRGRLMLVGFVSEVHSILGRVFLRWLSLDPPRLSTITERSNEIEGPLERNPVVR
ncbi:hypothetical protein P154DRAFT_578537 [Amniculicola lignicola CBS 123094]|uniref:Uncharacterized protein n=1 Tax=Amniculicola lignicola CBS 123094 TaxID=1392246 RepID=A0A6A5W9J8_9PLEO|nr:hypothetical protein P154DRAFT_578537 [Amniculicola lignicola CBS 123094]